MAKTEACGTEIAGLREPDGIKEFIPVGWLVKNLVADGGIEKSIGRVAVLSGLPSLELFKLVTKEEALDKWVLPILAESIVSVVIKSCGPIEKDELL